MKKFAALLTILILMNYGFTNSSNHTRVVPKEKENMQEPILSFALITDIHNGEHAPEQTRFYANSGTKLTRAMNEFSLLEPDFLINLGDLTDRDYSSFEETARYINSYGLETYHALGNHDYTVSRGQLRRIVRQTGSSEGYYSFDISGFRFIVLNGNEISMYAPNAQNRRRAAEMMELLNNESRPNAREYNGGISEKQLNWLAEQLDESRDMQLNAIIYCHFPVFPESPYNLLNDRQVLETLGNYDHIIAWFNGHNHQGGYGNYKMIHFITMKAMVESEESGAWAYVEVYGNRIWIHGSEREKSQILAW